MAKDHRTVTERVHPGGRLVDWWIVEHGADGFDRSTSALAVKQADDRWHVTVHPGAGSLPFRTLRAARKAVLGGNGRRTGGHSEVTHVVYIETAE